MFFGFVKLLLIILLNFYMLLIIYKITHSYFLMSVIIFRFFNHFIFFPIFLKLYIYSHFFIITKDDIYEYARITFFLSRMICFLIFNNNFLYQFFIVKLIIVETRFLKYNKNFFRYSILSLLFTELLYIS